MSKWTKQELENMLEDVVNELDLNKAAIEKHGQNGTSPAELVRLVMAEKDALICRLLSQVEQSDDGYAHWNMLTEVQKDEAIRKAV